MSEPKILTRENSKVVIENYALNDKFQTLFPTFDLNTAERIVFNDPVVTGALKQYVDKAMEGGYKLLKRSDKSLDTQTKERLEFDFEFSTNILRAVFVQGFKYQNAFIEIVRGGGSGEVIGLNVLDAKNVEPVTKPNGDPLKYRWRIPNDEKKGDYPTWTPDEVIWVKFYDSMIGWSPIDMQTLYKWVSLKNSVRNYVYWLWKTGQYRVVHNFKDASKGQSDFVDDFLGFMAQNDHDPSKPFITQGDYSTFMTRDMKETEYYDRLLKYIDQQILICLRVPPIDAGIPDASGRSNADAQSNNFSTTITGWKKVLKNALDTRLFPLLYKGNTMIVWGPNDRFQKKQIIDEINTFVNAGFSEEFVEEYMKEMGLVYDVKELFKKEEKHEQEEEVKEEINGSDERLNDVKDIDTMPSRHNIDSGEGSESIGSGEASSTREDQL